jgi:hypothetical protein
MFRTKSKSKNTKVIESAEHDKTMSLRQLMQKADKVVQERSLTPKLHRYGSRSPQQSNMTKKQSPSFHNDIHYEQVVKTDICLNEFKELMTIIDKTSRREQTGRKVSPVPKIDSRSETKRRNTPSNLKSPVPIVSRIPSKSPQYTSKYPIVTKNTPVMIKNKENSTSNPPKLHEAQNVCSARYKARSRSKSNAISNENQTPIDSDNQHIKYLQNHLKELKECVAVNDSLNRNASQNKQKPCAVAINDFERRLIEFETRKKKNLEKIKTENDPKFKPEINKKSALLDQRRLEALCNYDFKHNSRETSQTRGNSKSPVGVKKKQILKNNSERENFEDCLFKSKPVSVKLRYQKRGDQEHVNNAMSFTAEGQDKGLQSKLLLQINELIDNTFKQ